MLKVSLQVFLTTDELHWDESTRPKSDSDLNSDSDSNCAACGKVESIAIIMWACWLPTRPWLRLPASNAKCRTCRLWWAYPPPCTMHRVPQRTSHIPHPWKPASPASVGVRQLLIIAPDRRRPFCNTTPRHLPLPLHSGCTSLN